MRKVINDEILLTRIIVNLFINGDYQEGRFPFWFDFDCGLYGKHTLSSVELDGLLRA